METPEQKKTKEEIVVVDLGMTKSGCEKLEKIALDAKKSEKIALRKEKPKEVTLGEEKLWKVVSEIRKLEEVVLEAREQAYWSLLAS